MRELAALHDVRLPNALQLVGRGHPPELRATDERGWFRFQRLYDVARSVVREESDIRRLLREAAEDEAAEGSGWLEIQVDPTSYAPRLGGLTPAVEVILDAAREATAATGVGLGVIVAANRTRHPLDARTLARLAAQYAGRGVVGFGLSNDERRGRAEDFAPAFRIAAGAGLLAVPHGGQLTGPASVRAALDAGCAQRIGHGVRSVGDPALLERLAAAGARAGGLSGLERATRRLQRPRGGAAAPAARGRSGIGGAGRRRPVALRRAAARAVRDRPRRPRVQ